MMMKITNIKRGADPELFLVDIKGTPVSSIGLIGGSKERPLPFGDVRGFAVQEDNVAVEFNIPAASSKEEFISSIQFSLEHIQKTVGEKGLLPAIVPSMHFDREQLQHPKARHMGCDPDYNVYTLSENRRPKAPKTMRSAGGHLHLSWDNPETSVQEMMVVVHDLFCGCPSILHDDNTERRSLYGKAGAFRYKEYGVEWRTPSNFWIKSKELIDWMYSQSEKAVDFLNKGLFPDHSDFQMIQDCINNSNKEYLSILNKKYKIL